MNSYSDGGLLRFILAPAQGSFPGRYENETVGPFVSGSFQWLLELEDCDDDVPNMMLLQTHQAVQGSILRDKKDEILKQDDLVMAYAAWLRLGVVILHHHSFTMSYNLLLWRKALTWFDLRLVGADALLLSCNNSGNYHTRNYYLGTLKLNTHEQI